MPSLRLSHHHGWTVAAAFASVLASSCGSSGTGRGRVQPDARTGDARAPVDSGTRRSDAMAGDTSDDPDPVVTDEARSILSSLSLTEVPKPSPDPTNKWADDAAAAAFGQKLFFDASFSGKLLDGDNDGSEHALGKRGETGKVACAGCHQPAAGFLDARSLGQQIPLGAGWVLRRAPSLLDVSRSRLLTWSGRRDALYNQPFGPLETAVEMNTSRLFVAERVFAAHRAEYERLFGAMPPLGDTKRFPSLSAATTGCAVLDADNQCTTPMRGAPGDGAEYDRLSAADKDAVTRVVVNVGKALGAYERLLDCGLTPFDRWMNGDASALSRAAQRGAVSFATTARCATCHLGPFLSDEEFHNVGLKPTVVATVFLDAGDVGASQGLSDAIADPLNSRGAFSDGDDGRLPASVPAGSEGAFRTPKLRCVAQRPSFMHTGQFRGLDEVVAFFARGGDEFGFPGKSELSSLGLSPRERADLVKFLEALSGDGPRAELRAPP